MNIDNNTLNSLEEQKSELEKSTRLMAMGQMAASLAHEIRNPLGSIELYCGILKRELVGEKDKLDLLNHIQKGITNLSNIVSNCLLFTKDITVKKQVYNSAEVFLKETCRYVASQSCNDLKDNSFIKDNIKVTWKDVGDELFYMDPYIMGQIVINLLINSIDACIEYTKKIEHEVSVELDHSQKSSWSLLVKDTGNGIKKDLVKKLYDPFFTTKEKGTGLGLAIVHSLVDAHEGKIELETIPQNGTTFRIKFKNNINQK